MFDLLDGPVRDAVVALFDAIGYLGVALMIAIESVVVPLPSELILPFAGFLASDPRAIEPLTGARWDPLLIIIAGDIGSVVGALVAYAIGARGGRPLLLRYRRFLLLSPADIERGERFFARHGGKAALFGRVVPVVRSLVSFAAGMARMPLVPFTLYTAVGSLPWVAALVGAGVLLGASWTEIEAVMKPLERLVLAGLALGGLAATLLCLRARLGARRPSERADWGGRSRRRVVHTAGPEALTRGVAQPTSGRREPTASPTHLEARHR